MFKKLVLEFVYLVIKKIDEKRGRKFLVKFSEYDIYSPSRRELNHYRGQIQTGSHSKINKTASKHLIWGNLKINSRLCF